MAGDAVILVLLAVVVLLEARLPRVFDPRDRLTAQDWTYYTRG